MPRLQGGLTELGLVFLMLGVIAFGGPAAHVAQMRKALVVKRGWFGEDEFLRMFGACNLIPGPSSTELAILIGRRRASWPGMIVAGVSFILPAAVLVLGLAWAYVRWGRQPAAASVLAGVRPVVVGIVAWAAIDLGRRMIGDSPRALVAAAAAVMLLLGVTPVLIVVAAGLLLVAVRGGWRGGPSVLAISGLGFVPGTLLVVFLAFLKIGAFSFGSGYVLVAFLRSDVVQTMHWLSERQLVDAIAIGQATPGPLFTTATFIGFLVDGLAGSVAATIGIFLPAFVLIPFIDRLLRLVEGNRAVRAFVEGANAGSLGLIAAVAAQLAVASIAGLAAAAAAVAALAVMLRWPLAAPALVAVGAAAGLVGLIR